MGRLSVLAGTGQKDAETDLVKDIIRNPFEGIGKPEPLKGKLTGFWSRRIDEEHRLVYIVEDDIVVLISCRGHYDH